MEVLSRKRQRPIDLEGHIRTTRSQLRRIDAPTPHLPEAEVQYGEEDEVASELLRHIERNAPKCDSAVEPRDHLQRPEVHPKVYQASSASGNSVVQNGDVLGDVTNHYHYDVRTGNGLRNQALDEDYEKLKESLRFSGMGARLDNVAAAMPQTCSWLFKHDTFCRWMNNDDRQAEAFLWIKGKPGCGKSTLMKTAHDFIVKKNGTSPSPWLILSYFFNARARGELEKSVLGLYRSLLYDMVISVSQLKTAFLKRFRRKVLGDSIDPWTLTEMQNFLLDNLGTLQQPLCIFIDALDEGQVDDVQQMVSFCEDFLSRARAGNCSLRICFSSRHYPLLIIPDALTLTVEQEVAHDDDIRLYIRKKMKDSSLPEMARIADMVHARSGRIFLWVVLVVSLLNDSRRRGSTMKELENDLDQLPEDLDGLFTRILQSHGEGLQETTALFQWMLFAPSQLSLTQLLMAVRLSSKTAFSSKTFDDEYSYILSLSYPGQAKRRLLELSRGLLEITTGSQATVQFIHETVRFFLASNHGLPRLQPVLSDNLVGQSHKLLHEACDKYLHLPVPKCGELNDRRSRQSYEQGLTRGIPPAFDVMRYCVENAYRHAELAEANGVSQLSFLRKISKRGLWIDSAFRTEHDLLERYEVRKFGSDEPIPLLYALIDLKLPHLAALVITDGADVNAIGGRHGCALQLASANGDLPVIGLLLARGAHVNCAGGPRGHALTAALLGYHLDVAQCLIQAGAILDESQLEKTVLALLSRGHVPGLNVLFDARMITTATRIKERTMLRLAMEKRKIEVMECLLWHGAAADERGLMDYAVKTGDPNIVRLIRDACNGPHPDLAEVNLDKILRTWTPKRTDWLIGYGLPTGSLGPLQWLALLFEAIRAKSHEGLRAILDLDLKIDLDTIPSQQLVHAAIENECLGMARTLSEHRYIQPNLPSNIGNLHDQNFRLKSTSTTDLLLEYDAALDTPALRYSSLDLVATARNVTMLSHRLVAKKDLQKLTDLAHCLNTTATLQGLDECLRFRRRTEGSLDWLQGSLRGIYSQDAELCRRTIHAICKLSSNSDSLMSLLLDCDAASKHGILQSRLLELFNQVSNNDEVGSEPASRRGSAYETMVQALIHQDLPLLAEHRGQVIGVYLRKYNFNVSSSPVFEKAVISPATERRYTELAMKLFANYGYWKGIADLYRYEKQLDSSFKPARADALIDSAIEHPHNNIVLGLRNLAHLQKFRNHYRAMANDADQRKLLNDIVWQRFLTFANQPHHELWEDLVLGAHFEDAVT